MIKKGDLFRCIKDIVMFDNLMYTKGNYYKSEKDRCITNNNGEINHIWVDVYTTEKVKVFEKLYTIQDLKDGKVAVDNRTTPSIHLFKLAKFLGYSLNGYFDYYYLKSCDDCFYPTDSMPQLPLQKTEDFLVQLSKEDNYIFIPLSDFATMEEVKSNNTPVNPKHYSFNIKGTPCDLFDVGNAMDLNKEQFTALRYFRKKENQIEDTKKAIKCLERLVERLESEKND